MTKQNIIFNVNATNVSPNALEIDSDGNTLIRKLIMLDDETGRKWQIRISDGVLIVEPLELEDIREHRINKILK